MKKTFLSALRGMMACALAVCAMTCFTACSSDDDEPKVPENLGKIVEGTYAGYTSTSTAYFSDMITADESVTLKANENGTVSIAYTSGQWGEASIAEAQVSRTDAGFAIAGSGTLSMPGMGGAPAKDYECNVTGTISKDKKQVEITFSVPSVMGGTNIKFILGEAPATEE